MAKHEGLDGLNTTMLELEFWKDAVLFKGNSIVSNPPSGSYRIVNMYINEKGKLVIDWSDVPEA